MVLLSFSSISSLEALVTLTVFLLIHQTQARVFLKMTKNHLAIVARKDVVAVIVIVSGPKNIKPNKPLLKQLFQLSNYPLLEGFCK